MRELRLIYGGKPIYRGPSEKVTRMGAALRVQEAEPEDAGRLGLRICPCHGNGMLPADRKSVLIQRRTS